jgi:hypothetical protein
MTQNANESFNQMIWQRCPKTYWAGRKSVCIAVTLATLKFNEGAGGVFRFLQETTERQVKAVTKRNLKRIRQSSKEKVAAKLARRYKTRKKTTADTSYTPGGF